MTGDVVNGVLLLKQQAAKVTPPHGSVVLRVRASDGVLVTVAPGGTETPVPTVTSYADQTAANAAEAANVLYYNVATGKFQITTA